MPISPIRPPVVTDYSDPGERQTRTAIKALSQPGSQRITVRAVVLGTSTVRVPHQLGRIPTAWQVADKNAQADIWRDTSISTTSDIIPLKASAAVTVDLIFW